MDYAQGREPSGADRSQPARLPRQVFGERDLNHSAGPEPQIHRLEVLIGLQADELAQTYARIHKIIALCDLAEWAAGTGPEGPGATVLTDDIRHALASPIE
jgi:hypothetical protein